MQLTVLTKVFFLEFQGRCFFSLGMLMTSTTDAGFFCCCSEIISKS